MEVALLNAGANSLVYLLVEDLVGGVGLVVGEDVLLDGLATGAGRVSLIASMAMSAGEGLPATVALLELFETSTRQQGAIAFRSMTRWVG